jgi:hypothetical protein
MTQTNTPGPGDFASSVKTTPAITANGTNGANGINGSSDTGYGINGSSVTGYGVYGSGGGIGLYGTGDTAVFGEGHTVGVSGSGQIGVSGSSALLYGVHGTGEVGVYGAGVNPSSTGVIGTSNSGTGVYGSSETSGGFGVSGLCPSGTAIYGQSKSGLAGHFAGNVQIDNNLNVSGNVGVGTATPRNPLGIRGTGGAQELLSFEDPSGTTKWHINQDLAGNSGLNFAETGVADGRLFIRAGGNVGIGTTTPAARLDVMGDIHATGTKNFVQAHPTDPMKQIVYVALEGGEAGTYTRGTWKLEEGLAVIKLPEHFGLVTSQDGLSVQLTPRGQWLQLYVVQVSSEELVVQETQGKSGQFDYLIQGVRKGYEHHEVFQQRR